MTFILQPILRPAVRAAWLLAAAAGLSVLLPAAAHAEIPCELPGPSDPTTKTTLELSGTLPTELEGSYVYVPFRVPKGTTGIRVRYCHDQPELAPPLPAPNLPKHVIDLAVYEPRPKGMASWPSRAMRGGAGSAVRDISIARNGYTPRAVYEANRKAYVSGRTIRGYEPGPIRRGRWAAELGVAAGARPYPGDSDGGVRFGLQVELTKSRSWANRPYRPAGYDPGAVRRKPGWFAGDFHVHGEQEPGNASVGETLENAFAPFGGEGAGLDFITLLDHNTTAGFSEAGRYQDDFPRDLIIRSTEVTTYRGHINNHGGARVDYRTGPQFVAGLEGRGIERSLAPIDREDPVAPGRQARDVFAAIHARGGLTQINHPTIFPSEVPTFDDFCRGCAWSYDDAETDYGAVDAIEIATGPAGLQAGPFPGPNPFTPLAIRFWEDAIDSGGKNRNRIAAVASSDSHRALARSEISPTAVTDAPIGMATTMVHARRLSVRAILAAVRAGHTYVKPWGADGPDLRLTASTGGRTATIGDSVAAEKLGFEAEVLNLRRAEAARPGQYLLTVYRDGAPMLVRAIPGGADSFRLDFGSQGPGRYRLQVDRTLGGVASVEAVSTPIWLDPPG